ncbi:MAG: AbrB family transcriptional regulator [Thermoprotei archaeon]|nr:MAG: AbrB family transcriptional regulator [Thermoprotei archaeon]
MTEHVTRVLKKGVVVIPKVLREEVGIKEGDLVVVKRVEDRIVIEPLERRLTLVTVDSELVDRILREVDEEEKRLEMKKLKRVFGVEE